MTVKAKAGLTWDSAANEVTRASGSETVRAEGKEVGSFLKKRTKKLCLLGSAAGNASAHPVMTA
jgi:hypothetical protein